MTHFFFNVRRKTPQLQESWCQGGGECCRYQGNLEQAFEWTFIASGVDPKVDKNTERLQSMPFLHEAGKEAREVCNSFSV